MSIRKLTPNDILPLIADYLKKAGLPQMSEELEQYYENTETSLHKYSLVKQIKFYIMNKKKLLDEFQEQVEEEDNEEVQSEEEVEEQPKKKVKKQEQKITNQNGNQTDQNGNHQNGNKKVTFPTSNQVVTNDYSLEDQPRRFFQKVDDSKIHTIRTELRDNTFEAKQRFGQGDAYGELGNDKLKHTKGDSFKKEKGKLKNRQFQGNGSINPNAINSIKL